MLKLQLLRFVLAVFFSFLLLVNLVFAVGAGIGAVHGGVDGVKHWINHITYEGRMQITEVAPGEFRVTVPVVKHVYLRFVLIWFSILALTFGCGYLFRSCGRRIQALRREG